MELLAETDIPVESRVKSDSLVATDFVTYLQRIEGILSASSERAVKLVVLVCSQVLAKCCDDGGACSREVESDNRASGEVRKNFPRWVQLKVCGL